MEQELRPTGMVNAIGLGKDGYDHCGPYPGHLLCARLMLAILSTSRFIQFSHIRTQDSEGLSNLPEVIQHVRWLF